MNVPWYGGLPLLLLLPFVWRSGLMLARLATRDERLARFLSVGLAIALWLLSIHVVGLLSHSFFVGLFAGTVLTAAPGAFTFKRIVPDVKPADSTSPWLWVGMVAMMALIAWPQLRFEEHDECEPFGHVGTAQEIEAGDYPPRYPWFPAYEVRYHYGIDLATASVSAVLGHADISRTLHVITIALWGCAFSLLWLLGECMLGGALGGAVTASTTLLAGGFQLFCRSPNPLSLLLMGDCSPTGSWINPPFLSNFLQHPWTLGTPIGAAALLIFSLRRSNDWLWFAALWLLLTMLSLSQFAFFATLTAALCAAGCFEGWRPSPKLILRFGLLFVATVLAASQLHGFFAHGAEPKGQHFRMQLFWTAHPFSEWLAWNVQSVAFLIPLGLLGLIVMRKGRLLPAFLGFGGIVFANLFTDQNALFKLTTVAEIGLGLLASGGIVWMLRRKALLPVGAAALVACTTFSLCWAFAVGSDLPGLWYCKDLLSPPSPADQQAIAFLRRQAKPGELIFRAGEQNAKRYTLYGGLTEPYFDYNVFSHGFSSQLVNDRDKLMAHPSASPEPYLAQRFHWFVVEPNDREVSENLEHWKESGSAELRAEFPPLRVYYLRD